MTIGLVQAGKAMEIVNNFQSKRETPTSITFDRGERLFGSDSTAVMGRKPTSTFTKFSLMLGKSVDDPLIKALGAQYFPYEVYTNSTDMGGRNHVCIKQENTFYTPEELTAMMIQHAKQVTQKHGGQAVKDSVLTVPSYWTHHERRAIQNAADIADLRVLSLIEENTAAALYLGMERIFEEPHTVLFYNMGATHTQVSIVTYSSSPSKEAGGKGKSVGQFEVLGKGWDSTLGSHDMDIVLAELFADRFDVNWEKKDKKFKKGDTIRAHVQPMTKLKLQANKVKEVLSANPEFPVKMEQLHANVDLATKVTREEFEIAISDLLKRVASPIEDALAMAGLKLHQIDAVELLGGGVRVPSVKKILDNYFSDVEVPPQPVHAAEASSGSDDEVAGEATSTATAAPTAESKPTRRKIEVGQHLNGDEAMALGAAFFAASLSSSFRVRKVGMTDISAWPVSMALENLALNSNDKEGSNENAEEQVWRKETGLYPAKSPFASKSKVVAVQHTEDILCSLSYADQNQGSSPETLNALPVLPSGASSLFAVYNITGISDFVKEHAEKKLGKPKVQLTFTLDSSGMVSLSKAEALLELPKELEPLATGADAVATPAAAAATEGLNDKLNADGEPLAETSPDSNDSTEEHVDRDEASSDSTGENSDADAEGKGKGKKKSSLKKESAKAKKAKSKKGEDSKKTGGKGSSDNFLRATLTVSENFHLVSPPGMSSAHISESRAKLSELDAADAARRLRESALNELEQYILAVVNRIGDEEDELKTVSTEDQREEVKTLCREIEDWLYGSEAKSAGVSDLKAKLQGVKKVAKPLFDRYAESKARPLAVNKAHKKIADMQAKMANWTQTLPWITEEEKGAVIELIIVAEKWIADKEAEQAALETSVQPAFLASDVPLQLRAADAAFEKLKGKKKPEPPKVEKNETVNVNLNSTTTADFGVDPQVEDSEIGSSESQEHATPEGDVNVAPDSDSIESSSEAEL